FTAMHCYFVVLLFFFLLFLKRSRCDSSTDGNIYRYQAKTLNGSRTVNLSEYRGKSVLFVNVATY
uniref:Glutathione peroxidase n=1 Tax=Scophthalmus maximus TaxID=52904 RepID=A0A8D3A7J5_SCOMX